MSALDLPPGLGLEGTPLGTFSSPGRARWLASIGLVVVAILLAITWYFVSRHPYRWHASTQVVLPAAFLLISVLAFGIRRAKLAITRDGIRWGWAALSFTQPRARIVAAHVYADGITMEAHRGSRWFIAARDWERFDVIVRQLRRVEWPVKDYPGNAPIRQRLQSYGRFLDALVLGCIVGAFAVAIWAS